MERMESERRVRNKEMEGEGRKRGEAAIVTISQFYWVSRHHSTAAV